MVPKIQEDLRQEFITETLPSRTFRMQEDQKIIAGMADGLQAVKQAVFLILNVERYEWLIYSWNYGMEWEGLIGQPVDFCIPEIERRVREALLQDDRIVAVEDFTFQADQRKVLARFTVNSIFGSLKMEKEVVA